MEELEPQITASRVMGEVLQNLNASAAALHALDTQALPALASADAGAADAGNPPRASSPLPTAFEVMAAAPDALDDGYGGGLLDDEEPDLSRPGTAQEMQDAADAARHRSTSLSPPPKKKVLGAKEVRGTVVVSGLMGDKPGSKPVYDDERIFFQLHEQMVTVKGKEQPRWRNIVILTKSERATKKRLINRDTQKRGGDENPFQECLTIIEGDANDVATLGKTLSGNQAHAWLGFNVHPKRLAPLLHSAEAVGVHRVVLHTVRTLFASHCRDQLA
jgi:hypothetical protein